MPVSAPASDAIEGTSWLLAAILIGGARSLPPIFRAYAFNNARKTPVVFFCPRPEGLLVALINSRQKTLTIFVPFHRLQARAINSLSTLM
ncbi:hypothetical protein NTE_01114 [Candidatus Nitrososphaera evergladensis SR1]|uniref:Uncharacterized protein n=1 Tax=Candidatus Nitrososphaera evergladensis SR1 TaxID=1459636 RepID=A0A075MQP8_9ARCH|nr:hypothetical protein NTE_01114 [Candidatus Nitrososphaera evergladensis SR1]